jgi:hypothetical protein
MNIEAFGWTCIYLGMVVGVAAWFIVMITIFKDFKDNK